MSKNKFNLGNFDEIAKVNEKIAISEKDQVQKDKTKEDIDISKTQEIDLGNLKLNTKQKDLKIQKSLALRKSTIIRMEKLAKKFETSVSDIADKAIRSILKLEN